MVLQFLAVTRLDHGVVFFGVLLVFLELILVHCLLRVLQNLEKYLDALLFRVIVGTIVLVFCRVLTVSSIFVLRL